jgi:hypothetical protein
MASNKFSFDDIVEAPEIRSQLFVLFSPPKLGKTTLMCEMPRLFIACPEEGLVGIEKPAPHFRRYPRTLLELYEALDAFAEQNKGASRRFDHLCVDSLSWVETMIHTAARAEQRTRNLDDDFRVGWGVVATLWDEFFAKLKVIRQKCGAHVWLVAHGEQRQEAAPSGETYMKWDLQLEKKAAALVRKTVDHVLFMNYASSVTKGKKGRRATGQYKGRMIYFRDSPDHFAGSRSSAPEMCPATPRHLLTALASPAPADAGKLRAELAVLLPRLPEAERGPLEEEVQAARGARDLARVLSQAQAIAAQYELDEEDGDEGGAAPEPASAAPATLPEPRPAPPPAATPNPPRPVPAPAQQPAPAPAAEEPPPVPAPAQQPAPAPAASAAIERPAYVVDPPPAPERAAAQPSPQSEDDEAKARKIVLEALTPQACGKAFIALSQLKGLSADARTRFANEIRDKKASLQGSGQV